MKEKKLVRISTYANMIDKSVQWVYELEKQGNVKVVVIDKVKFIEL
jgi:reverse gyrase